MTALTFSNGVPSTAAVLSLIQNGAGAPAGAAGGRMPLPNDRLQSEIVQGMSILLGDLLDDGRLNGPATLALGAQTARQHLGGLPGPGGQALDGFLGLFADDGKPGAGDVAAFIGRQTQQFIGPQLPGGAGGELLQQGLGMLADGNVTGQELLDFGVGALEDNLLPEQWQQSPAFDGATGLLAGLADDGRLDGREILGVAGDVVGGQLPAGAGDWASVGLQAVDGFLDDGRLDGREAVGLAMSAAQHLPAVQQFASTGVGGAVVQGGVSAVNNIFAAINGDMSIGDAIAGTLVDTAIGVGAMQLGAAIGSFIPIPGVGTLLGAGIGYLVGTFGDDIIGWAKEGLGDLVDNAGQFLGDAGEWIGDAAGDVVDWVGDAAGKVGEVAGDVIETVGDAAGDVVDAVGGVVEDVGDAIGDFFGL